MASYNILHDGYPAYQNKALNAADLLAARGLVDPATLSVLEPPDQAPYEWEADIIGLQELKDVSDQDVDPRQRVRFTGSEGL